MVGTIIPVVNGKKKGTWVSRPLAIYTLASLIGSAAMGALAEKFGEFSRVRLAVLVPGAVSSRTVLLAAVALVLSATELRIIRFTIPQCKRQVPANWRLWNPDVMAFCYGGVLGIGFGTRIPVTTLYAVGTFCFLSDNAMLAGIVFSLFGLGRSIPLWVVRNSLTRGSISNLSLEISSWREVVPILNGIAMAVLGGTLLFNQVLRY